MRNFSTQNDNCSFEAITNTAHVQGYYTTSYGGNLISISDEDSVSVSCIFADISKTADKDNVSPGDRIKYTIKFKNMSDKEMFNVKIVDDLSSYLTVVPNSIIPTPLPGESLPTGISLGAISPKAEKTLTFSAIVSQDATEDIVNRAFADFNFIDQNGQIQSASTHITSITTPIEIEDVVSIEKTADKTFVTSNGEQIQYTITVTNNSPYNFEDVVVNDMLPECLTYVEGSTIINDNPPIDSNPAGGIYFGSMLSGSVFTIQFSASVNLLK